MDSKIQDCSKCGGEKTLIFRPYKKGKNGTLVYPRAARCFPMWVCNNPTCNVD